MKKIKKITMKKEKIKRKVYYILPSEIKKVDMKAKKEKVSGSIVIRGLISTIVDK